mgnify:CR=1 FL=1
MKKLSTKIIFVLLNKIIINVVQLLKLAQYINKLKVEIILIIL